MTRPSKKLLTFWSISLLICSKELQAEGTDPKTDLLGTWQSIRVERDGEVVEGDAGNIGFVHFTSKQIRFEQPTVEKRAPYIEWRRFIGQGVSQYTIDASVAPMRLDIADGFFGIRYRSRNSAGFKVGVSRYIKCIFSIGSDELRIAYSKAQRPKNFGTASGDSIVVVTYRRTLEEPEGGETGEGKSGTNPDESTEN